MLGLVLFIVLVYGGALAKRLTWRPFVVLAGIAVFATAWAIPIRIENYARLGEDVRNLRDPAIFVGNAAIQYTIYLLIYLAGFGAGKFWRWRQTKSK